MGQELFAMTCERYYPEVLLYCRERLGGDTDAAAAVTQVVFLRLYRQLEALSRGDRLHAWLLHTADRRIAAYHKKHPQTASGDVPALDEAQMQHAVEEGLAQLTEAVRKRRRPWSRRKKCVLATILAVILVGNLYTIPKYHMPFLYTLLHDLETLIRGRYPDTVVEIPTSPDDPYGIKTECAKSGLEDIYAPTYLPEGFELADVQHHVVEGYCTSVRFWFYRDQKEVITITYNSFDDPSCSSNIPCDHFDLTEIEIDGMPAIVSKEDGQCALQFRKDAHLEILIWHNHLDYQECDKVIASLAP